MKHVLADVGPAPGLRGYQTLLGDPCSNGAPYCWCVVWRNADDPLGTSPASRASTPVTQDNRGPSPALSRLTPITEDVAGGSLDNEGARRAWDPTHQDAQAERQIKIRACTDLVGVLNTVPSAYRGVLSDLFARYTEQIDKRDQLSRARSKLQGLLLKGEVPFNYNSLRVPSVQFQKGMKDLWNETFNLPAQEKIKALQNDLLAMEVSMVEKSLLRLDGTLDERDQVKAAWIALGECFDKRPNSSLYRVEIPQNSDWPVDTPELVVSQVNPLRNELRALQVDLPVYFRKVLDLKLDLIQRTHGHREKKAAEKRVVDTEMKDVASSSNPEVKNVINNEVNRQVAAALAPFQKMLASSGAGPSSSSKVSKFAGLSYRMDPTNSAAPVGRFSEEEAHQNQEGQEEGEKSDGDGQGGCPRDGPQGSETPSWRRWKAQQEWERRQRQRETESTVEALKRKPWTFGVPQSYPDEILTLSPSYQADVLLSRAPLSLLDSNRFRSPIHVQPGLDVPLQIQHDLSASLKFMFETKIDKSLIQKSYSDLVRRIRWKWYFMDQAGDEYDPDYDVEKETVRTKRPPTAHPHIERGLQAGQDYVSSVMTLLPDANLAKGVPSSLNLKRAREFVVANNLIVTSTDKNLGVAVFKREWIHSQAVALFADEDNYHQVTSEQAVNHLSFLHDAIHKLCQDHLVDSKQLSTFLKSNLPIDGEQFSWQYWERFVPEAYAIPKIHKKPWKGRPICPGFCLPQNPASKVLSKTVRPFIDQIPWVIQGSKDFVRKLAGVRVPPGRKAFIVSADVVAFYPSVDTDTLRNILHEFALHTLVEIDVQKEEDFIPPSFRERRLDWYDRLFEIALAAPVMTFHDKIFAQICGLPMGAAGSPDAANIFGYWYEQLWMDKVDNNPDILFYGRYLDDVFSIVLADTPDEARDMLAFVSLGDVKLLWEPPADSANFLDLSIRIDEDGSIHHEPFVKAMSHRERIPWSSAHPLDVKRGTFSSEISRLATLCSDKSVYLTQCDEAVNLYIGRGYPPATVRSWLNKQLEHRWQDRIADKAEDPSVVNTYFTLKTHFNDAWKSFNVGEMQTKITSCWKEYDSAGSLGKRRRATGDLGRPPTRRVRVALQGHQYPGQSRLQLAREDGGEPDVAVGLDGVHNGISRALERLKVSNWTKKWVDTAKFLVSRRRNTQLWDLTRTWNKVVWDAYVEQSGMRRPFDPLYEGPVILNEEDA